MSSKIYIKQNVDAAVEFWGASDFHATKTADAPKLRLMEVHPTKSLIVAADRDGKVMLWDYEQHQTIMNTTCALLVLEKSNVSNDKSSPAPSSTGLHGRLTARSNNRLTGSITNKPSIASTLAYRSTGTLHSNSPSSNYAPVVQNKMKQQLGQVLQVCFADASYKRSCAGPGAYAHRALPSARSSETRITIVCENALIFHDYATKATTALTAAELGRANPTCVEPISTTCLIGCSDGLIRVWDEEHAPEAHQYSASSSGAGPALAPVPAGGIALTLNTHSKCEVTAIKAVPIRK
jgi:WD40 repeat protein